MIITLVLKQTEQPETNDTFVTQQRSRTQNCFSTIKSASFTCSDSKNITPVKLLSLLLTHASAIRDQHHSLSHMSMGEMEFDLCWGRGGGGSKQYAQVALGDPESPIPRSLCLRLCLSSPRVFAGPWEEPGTHRH